MDLHSVYWDVLKPESCHGGWSRGHDVLVVWPAPVNADSCFSAAGFRDFADQTDQWFVEWGDLLDRLLSYLRQLGSVIAIESPEVFEELPTWQRLLNWLHGRPTRRSVHLTLRQQLELVTRDDQFGNVVLQTHSADDHTPVVRVEAGEGHELLFVQVMGLDPGGFLELVSELAAGRPVVRKSLDWSHLA